MNSIKTLFIKISNELAHCTLQSIQETLGGKNIMLGNNIVIIV